MNEKEKLQNIVLTSILVKLCVCEFLNRARIWEEFVFFAKIFNAKAADDGSLVDVALGMIPFWNPDELGNNVQTLKDCLAGDMIEVFDRALADLTKINDAELADRAGA
jgi:hypothetical protein